MMMTKLDEQTIIKIFQRGFGNKKFVSEDVEILNFGKTKIIAKTDTMVQSTDIPDKMKISDAARKSVIACVSDFAAKGVKPEYAIISINLPKNTTQSKINEILKGFKKAAKEYNISILGGDTNEGKEIVFNICIFGKADNIITRRGAKINDSIFVTGPFGYTPVGLDIILKNKKIKFPRAIKSVTNPKPKLSFGLKNKRYITSSMDSSDGLSTTLHEMSKQSKTKFVINNIPAMKDLIKFANTHKLNLDNLIFNGGEEYEFVFTVPTKYKQIIKKNAKLLNTPIIEIGYVTSGCGVYVQKDKKYTKLKDLGWRHFR